MSSAANLGFAEPCAIRHPPFSRHPRRKWFLVHMHSRDTAVLALLLHHPNLGQCDSLSTAPGVAFYIRVSVAFR